MKKILFLAVFFYAANFAARAQQPYMFTIPYNAAIAGASNVAFFAGTTTCYLVTYVSSTNGNTNLGLSNRSAIYQITNGICPTNCDITGITPSTQVAAGAVANAIADINNEMNIIQNYDDCYNAFMIPATYLRQLQTQHIIATSIIAVFNTNNDPFSITYFCIGDPGGGGAETVVQNSYANDINPEDGYFTPLVPIGGIQHQQNHKP